MQLSLTRAIEASCAAAGNHSVVFYLAVCSVHVRAMHVLAATATPAGLCGAMCERLAVSVGLVLSTVGVANVIVVVVLAVLSRPIDRPSVRPSVRRRIVTT